MNPKNDCPSREALIDLTYEELEQNEAQQVRMHIECCPACSKEYTQLLQLLKLADELPGGPVMPSPAVEARLKEFVARDRSAAGRFFAWLWQVISSPIPAYQALLMGAAIALFVQILSGEGTETAPSVASRPAESAAVVASRPSESTAVVASRPSESATTVVSRPAEGSTDENAEDIRKIEPAEVPGSPLQPRHTLRFQDEMVAHTAIAEVF